MSFDIDETIQSQYAASPTITALARSIWKVINPADDIELFYSKMFNPDTAEGVGLDVWGRIVAMPREYTAVDVNSEYLGFNPPDGVINERAAPFNQAPFYSEITGKVRLSDNAYRVYIFLKALVNIGNSSLAGLNQMLHMLLPDKKIMLQHVDTMTVRLTILNGIDNFTKAALLSIPWLPAGVELQLYEVITPTFGFNGQELQPFNQGTFATNPPQISYSN